LFPSFFFLPFFFFFQNNRLGLKFYDNKDLVVSFDQKKIPIKNLVMIKILIIVLILKIVQNETLFQGTNRVNKQLI
jgi:hypothetical protein